MNRRLACLAGLFATTITVVIDPNTQERFTDQAQAAVTTVDPLWNIPTEQVYVPGDCSTLFVMAMDAGWTWVDWPRLSKVMYRESRCIASRTNLKGRDRSYGLLQINTKGNLWDKPIAWGHPGLKDLCGLTVREELLDPFRNLECGRLLFEVHEIVYDNGWKPW